MGHYASEMGIYEARDAENEKQAKRFLRNANKGRFYEAMDTLLRSYDDMRLSAKERDIVHRVVKIYFDGESP